MNWLLEKDIFENLDALKQAIVDNGDTYNIAQYAMLNLRLQKPIDINEPTFVYGSLGFAKAVQKQYAAFPLLHVYMNLPQFKCTYYYPRLYKHLLQQNSCFFTYGELTTKKDWILKTFSSDGAVFVRPDSGFKTFTGKLIYEETWDKDVEQLGFYDVTPETLCVVAEPQNLEQEWRIIVKDREAVTGCQYKYRGRLVDSDIVPPIVYKFARTVLNLSDYNPDPMFVLDIAANKYSHLSVIEVNSMSASGYYTCKLDNIVKAVKQSVKEISNAV